MSQLWGELDAGTIQLDDALVTLSHSDWTKYSRSLTERAYFMAARIYRTVTYLQPGFARAVKVNWGVPHAGKSYQAYQAGAVPIQFIKGSCFFNGAEGLPKIVLFDEFDWRDMPMQLFLQITERYPIFVNVKGGKAPWVAEEIFFTSNDDPVWWYRNSPAEEQPPQVTRRIWNRHSRVTHFAERMDSDDEGDAGAGDAGAGDAGAQ